ncbi:MAG: hypothetical protein GXY47_07650 [Acidobacteria bacterium]|nr:hypothetical protein [Acidobacteriota bacterium]
MKIPVFCGLAVLLLAAAAAGEGDYAQSYVILIKGEPVGSESVRETVGDDGTLTSVSEHEIIIADGNRSSRMAYTARMVFSAERELISYHYRYTSGSAGDSFEVTVDAGRLTRVLTRSGQTSEITVPFTSDMVIFDFNVYHQADYLAARYDEDKGGAQTFANFIPVVGADLPLVLTPAGTAKLETAAGEVPVRSFRLELVGIWTGNLAVDGRNRLVRLSIPARDLEVVRADLAPGVTGRSSLR